MKHCDIFVLCEGRSDAEVFKLLIHKLNVEFDKNVAITDCEGRDELYEIASILVTLKKLFRKVKSLAVVVDADGMEYEARFQSLLDSLKSKGFEVSRIERLTDQLYKLIHSECGALQIYIAINGVMEYKFAKHELEDHAVKLLELTGKLARSEIERSDSAKSVLNAMNTSVVSVIENTENTLVEQAISHLATLIKHLAQDP